MIALLRDRVARLRAGYLDRPFTSVQLLLLSGGVLLVLGILMSVSTSISASLYDGSRGTLWTQLSNEVLFVGIGLAVLWMGYRMSPRAYRALVYPILLFAVVLMLAVFVPHVGVTLNGAHRWLRLGPIQIQPSEFGKLAMLLWGADLLARKEELRTLTSMRRLLVPLLPGFAIICAIVMREPDLGTTLCFLTILVGLLWTVGLPARYFAAVLALTALAVLALAYISPYRWERMVSFTHPGQDTSNTGHQALQGLYALATGGWWGVGLGSSTSKYGWVPNASTDYVFAILGEELGMLGCLLVLAAFAVFSYAALRVARRSNDTFVRLAASGTAVWISGQALINIGYVTGLLPVTGIPLPFVSAGGTSLVLTMGVLGMMLSFARHEPEAVTAAAASAGNGSRSRLLRLLVGVAKPQPQRQRPARPARPARAAQAARPARPARPGAAARPAAAARRTPVARTAQHISAPRQTMPPSARRPQSAPVRTAQPVQRAKRLPEPMRTSGSSASTAVHRSAPELRPTGSEGTGARTVR